MIEVRKISTERFHSALSRTPWLCLLNVISPSTTYSLINILMEHHSNQPTGLGGLL